MRFRDEAEVEIGDAVAWLAERDREAARQLLLAIDRALDQIATFPSSGSPATGGCRLVTLGKYRYQVVYQAEGDDVLIIALANTSRRPGYWRDRLPGA